MEKSLICYKELLKRIRLLPLDSKSIRRYKCLTKLQFKSSTKPWIDTSRYQKQISLLDQVLVREDYDKLKDILDVIYKDEREIPNWLQKFQGLNYLMWQRDWPQVHLVYQLTKHSKFIQEYEDALTEEKNDDLSLVRYFGYSNDNELRERGLVPLKRDNEESSKEDTLIHIAKLHKFLLNHQKILTHLKIKPLEVIYPTNRFSLPIHVSRRQKLLKQKITYIKNLFKTFRPIEVESLKHLIDVALYKQGQQGHHSLQLNELFYRYMTKKHRIERISLSPTVKKYTRKKRLIPNDNNIRKILRQYVKEQFYIVDGDYKLSWMQNFYENNHQVTDYNSNII